MQRLTTIDYINGFQQTKQYGYDALSNIEAIQSTTSTSPSTGVLGGPVNHSYTYDDYNRLIHAQGHYVGPNDHIPEMLRQEYSLEMLYDESHSILTKTQNHRMDRVTNLTTPLTNSASHAPTAYHLEYEDYNRGQFSTDGYSYTQPHAPRVITQYPIDNPNDPNDPRVEKQLLDYDTRGNLTHIEREINNPELPMDTSRESVQKLVWDEEDRLLGVDLRPESDRGQPHIAAYTYDAGGERGIRYVPRQQEGMSRGTTSGYAQDMDIMLYPNALITVRPQELPEDFDPMRMHPEHTFTTYTKHYYIGSERINSKLGTVKDLGVLCEQIGGNDLIDEMNTRAMDAGERLEDLHTDLDKDLRLNSPYPYSREHQFVCDFKSHNPELYDAYWYHPDHLGSSSYITNTTGEISQHMEYLPFGETLVEEHLNSYNSPFKFNGKEYDAETGNYYMSARYYSQKYNLMLGVDPASELYPGISPYIFALQNPVRFIDPTGMVVEGGGQDPPSDDKKLFPHTAGVQELGEVTIIASAQGTNLSHSGYSEEDFRIRSQIFKSSNPISRALLSAERKGNYRSLYDSRNPYAGFSSEFSAGWNNIDKDGVGNFWMNATAVGVGVPLLAASPLSTGLFSRGSLQAGLLKSGVSASAQFVINQQINFVGAFADGFMLPGVGDFVGAGFEVGINFNNFTFYSDSVFQNKSMNQVLFQGSVGTLFSTKIIGLDLLTPATNQFTKGLLYTPHYIGNITLQNYSQ